MLALDVDQLQALVGGALAFAGLGPLVEPIRGVLGGVMVWEIFGGIEVGKGDAKLQTSGSEPGVVI